jgi:hypothetical protein
VARYLIEVEPMPGDGRPDAVRLRQALKYLGRVCRLRCVGIRSETSSNEKRAAVIVPTEDSGVPAVNGDASGTT